MTEQFPTDPKQNLNITDGSSLNDVQIGSISGRDSNVNQIYGQVINMTVLDNIYSVDGLDNRSSSAISSQKEYRYREFLLNTVKKSWIQDVLEKSLHNRVLIELGWQEQPDLVQDLFVDAPESGESIEQTLAEGINITHVFEDLGTERTLLILGKPGSGKTITLLKIAESLIDHAEKNLDSPIPVILNLSSWENTGQDIAGWLIEELKRIYKIKKYLAKKWIEEESLILLLDGLDEVQAQHRKACIEAINRFRDDHGITEIVVCSRIKDYTALSTPLELNNAIHIHPLSCEQVNWYLDQSSQQLEGLRSLLEDSTSLQDLSRSPLMLSIMILAYQGLTAEEIKQTQFGTEKRQKKLFNTYIQRMLRGVRSKSYSKLSSKQTYTQKQSISYLNWLALIMQSESEKVFFIEEIQPDYLFQKKYKVINYFLVIIAIILTHIFFYPILYNLLINLYYFMTEESLYWSTSLISSNVIGGSLIGTVIVFYGLVDKSIPDHKFINPFTRINIWSFKEAKKSFYNQKKSGFYFGALFSIILSLIAFLELGFNVIISKRESRLQLLYSDNVEVITINTILLELCLIFTFVLIVFFVIEKTLIFLKIFPNYTSNFFIINFFTRKLSLKLALGGVSILLFGICILHIIPAFFIPKAVFLINLLLSILFYHVLFTLILVPIVSITFGLLGAIFGGWFHSKTIPTTYANQGIKNLATKTIIFFFILSIIIGFTTGIILYFQTGNSFAFNDTRLYVLSEGLKNGLLFGTILSIFLGADCIKHFVLRLILYQNKYIPWDYARFLDYATDRGILQKVNGGYQFIHRTLMEHFANMNFEQRKS